MPLSKTASIHVAALLATLSTVVLVVAAAQPGGADRFAQLDALVRTELERTGAPGAAVVITEGSDAVRARGYGLASVETRAPVTPDTLFQIGSVTKSFTAAAILSAAGEGLLSLERSVGTVVAGITACVGQPTLGQLLSHAGGLIDEPAEFGPQGEEGLAAYARSWSAEYCLLPPGRVFSYSNSGFALAGLALQEREQKPFADLMRARVLEPLGMTRTTFRPTEAMTCPLAVGHRRRDGVVAVVRPLPNDARLWPAGTLYSSANDMAHFLFALANQGRAGTGQSLPAAVVEAMMTPHMPMPTVGSDYGHGLELDRFHDHRRVGHGGSMTGYAAVFSVLPERRIGVAVLANGDGALLSSVAERALDLALGTAPATTPPPSPAAAAGPRVPAQGRLDGYVGSFANPRRFTVEVVRRGDALVLRRFGRDFPMRPIDASRFAVDRPGGGQETIVFGLDAGGRAEYLQMNVWALARTRP
jgi:CubicO group peptidase (beta-lactamase class C family)